MPNFSSTVQEPRIVSRFVKFKQEPISHPVTASEVYKQTSEQTFLYTLSAASSSGPWIVETEVQERPTEKKKKGGLQTNLVPFQFNLMFVLDPGSMTVSLVLGPSLYSGPQHILCLSVQGPPCPHNLK